MHDYSELGNVAKNIRLLLLDHNMTTKELSEASGISPSNISKKLKNNSFSISDLEKIAAAVGSRLEINFISKNTELQKDVLSFALYDTME